MKYLLAHDLGTSGNKATLFTVEGELVNSVVISYETKWYNNGWAEQDANVWYDAVCQSTQSILKGITPDDVAGVSFSGQMMGCLCVDLNGIPLCNSIIWADLRASKEETVIREQVPAKEFYRITGHKPSASYSLAKLLWIKNNQPEIYSQAYKVLNAKDYILFKLTNEFVTDYSDASGTNLLDINTLKWSSRIANAVEVDLSKMPELRKSTDLIGGVTFKASKETGLPEGTPIICGGGDGSMSAVGARCIGDGNAFCTIGTSAWNAITSNEPIYDPEMRTFNWVHVVPDKYIPCGTMQAAGASLSWLRDQLAQLESQKAEKEGINTYKLIDQIVDTVSPTSNGLLYLPYLLGERSPRWGSRRTWMFCWVEDGKFKARNV